MDLQHTLSKKVELEGIGLHSGRRTLVQILPAAPNTGIVFKRTDLPACPLIHAHVTNVTSTELNTTLTAPGTSYSINTVEHLMAALFGLGIDNAVVHVDGPEVPVLDGSAEPFVKAMIETGIVAQQFSRRYLKVKETFELKKGDKWVRIEPSDQLSFAMEIDFSSQMIGKQTYELNWSKSAFLNVSDCRTFCHVRDVDAMRKVGLAIGGSLENAVVVSDSIILNPEGLRRPDEFVRHKMLDMIGDLALMGTNIIGKFSAYKSGHGLHAAFMRELYERREELFTVVEAAPETSLMFTMEPESRKSSFALKARPI